MSKLAPAADTIFALSSGQPPAAIAVIRISGAAAGETLRALAGRMPQPRRMSARALHGPSGELLDQGLVVWLPGPNSVTGEDIVELHVHGGRAVVTAVLAALAAMPRLRMAEPGEFTRRALLNGRLALPEAEGLADLLEAETDGQRRNALRLVEGGLGRLAAGWRSILLDVAASCEAAIDHEDELGEQPFGAAEQEKLIDLAGELRLRLRQPPAERLRNGVRIVIGGPVNAGKSSLLNALAGRDVAIASPIAGTTRDVIEAPVTIDGLPCILVDGAGLRETDDPIERIGVARAHEVLASADLILWLGDAAHCPTPNNAMIVQAKSDLTATCSSRMPADAVVSIYDPASVLALRTMMMERVAHIMPTPDGLALHGRHLAALRKLSNEVEQALSGFDTLLIAEHLRAALYAIDTMIGFGDPEALLDALFARFCLGK